jgi:hypothetical protein
LLSACAAMNEAEAKNKRAMRPLRIETSSCESESENAMQG